MTPPDTLAPKCPACNRPYLRIEHHNGAVYYVHRDEKCIVPVQTRRHRE